MDSEQSPTTLRLHIGPGSLWTGRRRSSADAALVRLVIAENDGGRKPMSAVIEQLHDLNVARHRSDREAREHLQRCAAQLAEEGLIFEFDGEWHRLAADRVRVARKMTMHLFHSVEGGRGPFASSDTGEHG